MVGATNHLLLEIAIESRQLTKDWQAIDRDAFGDHFVAGNGNEITSVVSAIGRNINHPAIRSVFDPYNIPVPVASKLIT